MKIKEVGAKTGLTDKAIRTYIRNGLVFPNYDENYLGRKSWNFTDDDVKRLKQIAILRKYEFSLKDIKTLFDGEVGAYEFLDNHINELKHNVDENIDTINCMVNVIRDNVSDADELCDKLNNPEIAGRPIPVVDNSIPYKLKYVEIKKTRRIMSVVLAIALALSWSIRDDYLYFRDNNCVISSDYTTINYEHKRYKLLDTCGLCADYCTTLVEHPVFESGRHYFKDMYKCIYSVDGVRSDELFLFDNNNGDFRYYAEESVYEKYETQIKSFKGKYLCSIKQNDNGTGFLRFFVSDELTEYINSRSENSRDIDNFRITSLNDGEFAYIELYSCDDGVFHTSPSVFMDGFEGSLYYYTDEDMVPVKSDEDFTSYNIHYHYIEPKFYDEIKNMGYNF